MKLTIAIPTVVGREEPFKKLCNFLEHQIRECKAENDVEVISLCDNKEISIGAKRQKLYEMAKGVYTWQIDDDDWVHDKAVQLILNKIDVDRDCITFKERCIMNGVKIETSATSIHFKKWGDKRHGFDHVRTPFYKNPIKTDLCLRAGVKDMRYGEDHQFSIDLLPLLSTEIFINEFIYIYRYNSKEDFNKKYGIK